MPVPRSRRDLGGTDERASIQESDQDRTGGTHQVGWRATVGKPRVSRSAAVLGGAAILLWVLVVALNPVTGPRPGDTSASPPNTSTGPASLPIGPYLLWEGAGVGADITVTLTTAGWGGTPGDGTLLKNDNPDKPNAAGLIVFSGTDGAVAGQGDLYVYRDACRWSTTRPNAPVMTADEAAAALANQASSDPSLPIDVAVGRHAGKAITLRVPDDTQFERCDQGEFRFFIEGADNPRGGHVPGQIDEFWIVSPGNTARLVIFDIVYDEAISPGLIDELREMVGSATFR